MTPTKENEMAEASDSDNGSLADASRGLGERDGNLLAARTDEHCADVASWIEFASRQGYATSPRSRADLSDFALANAVFMASRDDLNLTVYQTAAKERIRWLSVQLALANQKLTSLREDAKVAGYKAWPHAEDIDESPAAIITNLAAERDSARDETTRLMRLFERVASIVGDMGGESVRSALEEREAIAADCNPLFEEAGMSCDDGWGFDEDEDGLPDREALSLARGVSQ